MGTTVKAGLIAGGIVLAVAAGLMAFIFIRDSSKPQTAQEAYDQTLAATDARELLDSLDQALALDCDEWRLYSELMDQVDETNPEFTSRFEDGLVSELSFAELASLGLKMMTKETTCGGQTLDGSAARSAENNLRIADVGEIAAAANQYMSNQNALPESWAEIAPFLDHGGSLQVYYETDINPANSLNESVPAEPGSFPVYSPLAEEPSLGMIHHDDPVTAGNSDIVVVLREAACNDDNSWPVSAGVREMAILYRLDGQTGISCREV